MILKNENITTIPKVIQFFVANIVLATLLFTSGVLSFGKQNR